MEYPKTREAVREKITDAGLKCENRSCFVVEGDEDPYHVQL